MENVRAKRELRKNGEGMSQVAQNSESEQNLHQMERSANGQRRVQSNSAENAGHVQQMR